MSPPAGATVLIANPAAGRGRGGRVLAQVREALVSAGVTTVHVTRQAGEERAVAEAAARAGAGTIVAVGGDGTWGNVARGILASGVDTRLALVAAGSGNDLAHGAGIVATDVRAALAIALGEGTRRIDVGLADGVHFLNCLGFGFDAEVLRSCERVRWIRGHAMYLTAALREIFSYHGLHARVMASGHEAVRDRYLLLVIANGPRFGGGFRIAPEARLDDGVLDIVRVGDASPWRRVALLASAVSGRHVGAPEVRMERSNRVALHFDAPPPFQADGELHQASTSVVSVQALPGALRLAVGAPNGAPHREGATPRSVPRPADC